jgi:hypothetical protein
MFPGLIIGAHKICQILQYPLLARRAILLPPLWHFQMRPPGICRNQQWSRFLEINNLYARTVRPTINYPNFQKHVPSDVQFSRPGNFAIGQRGKSIAGWLACPSHWRIAKQVSQSPTFENSNARQPFLGTNETRKRRRRPSTHAKMKWVHAGSPLGTHRSESYLPEPLNREFGPNRQFVDLPSVVAAAAQTLMPLNVFRLLGNSCPPFERLIWGNFWIPSHMSRNFIVVTQPRVLGALD